MCVIYVLETRVFFRPEFAVPNKHVGREECVRRVVWFGLENLSELAEMLTPVIETLVLPSQMATDIIFPETERAGLFKRGEGVNVYSEDLYMIISYHQAISKYLDHNKDGLKLTANIGNLLETKDKILGLLEKEEGIFRQSRSKLSYKYISSLRALLSLVLHNDIIKIQDRQTTETESFLEHLNQYKLLDHLMI